MTTTTSTTTTTTTTTVAPTTTSTTTTTVIAEKTKAECLASVGEQWEYGFCMKSTPGNNKADCLAIGDKWFDGVCAHVTTAPPPPTLPWYQATTQAECEDGGNLWIWALPGSDALNGGSCVQGNGQ
jgi:hypothetical protein